MYLATEGSDYPSFLNPNGLHLFVCLRFRVYSFQPTYTLCYPLSPNNWTEVFSIPLQAVRNGDLKIIPSMHEKIWYNWLENCRLVMCNGDNPLFPPYNHAFFAQSYLLSFAL